MRLKTSTSWLSLTQLRGDSFTAGKPRIWSTRGLNTFRSSRNYDVAPDGKRIAAILASGMDADKQNTHLTFLLNFFDELRRKVPLEK